MLLKAIILCASVTLCLGALPVLYRPCKLTDYACIRDYLASNSACQPQWNGYVRASYKLPGFKFETPYFNATYYDSDLIIRNHDKCFVSEFVANLASKTMVMSLDCPWLNFESTRTLFSHRSYREDNRFHFSINGSYPLIRLTTNFHPLRPINLCRSFSFADVAALPIFHIDPKDKKTDKYLTRDLTALNIYEIEMAYYRAPWLLKYFINNVLCDFGCDY